MRGTSRLLLALIALLCWLAVYLWDRAQKLDHAEFVADQRLLVAHDLMEEKHDLLRQVRSLRDQMNLRRG